LNYMFRLPLILPKILGADEVNPYDAAVFMVLPCPYLKIWYLERAMLGRRTHLTI
jgi:hypothetical protein